jgi:hypothetical protein
MSKPLFKNDPALGHSLPCTRIDCIECIGTECKNLGWNRTYPVLALRLIVLNAVGTECKKTRFKNDLVLGHNLP